MRIGRARRYKAGYTLIEVVVATAILVIGLGGLFNAFGYGFLLTQIVRENQRATQIILEKVEIIRLYRWEQVNTPGFIPSTINEDFDPQSPSNPGIKYTGSVSIVDFPGTGASYAANVKQLVVTLNWTTAGKIPHTRTLATLIAKDGMQPYVY